MDWRNFSLVGHLLSNVSKLIQYIIKLHTYVKSKGRSIKIIRTDDAFLTTEITEYCARENIVLQACVPYEHGQLGQIERSHRTIQESVVKALHNKPHITEQYWGMAYKDAIFKLNLVPVESNDNQVPYTVWEGLKPNIVTTHAAIWYNRACSHSCGSANSSEWSFL